MNANELLYLFVGAGLAVGGQLLVQLRVVPRADQRRRREDRWEKDVLALGELLTAELPDRATAAESAQFVMQAVVGHALTLDIDGRKLDDIKSTEQEKVDEAIKRYRAAAQTRLSWLAKRIIVFAPDSRELRRFNELQARYHMASVVSTLARYPERDFDEERFRLTWDGEAKLRGQLVDAVDELITGSVPRNPSRLTRVGLRLVDRVRKRVQARRARAAMRRAS